MAGTRRLTQFSVLTELAEELVVRNKGLADYLRDRKPGEAFSSEMMAGYMEKLEGMPIYFKVGRDGNVSFSNVGKDLFEHCYRKAVQTAGGRYDLMPPVAVEKVVPVPPVPMPLKKKTSEAAVNEPAPVTRKELPKPDALDELQYNALRSFVGFVSRPEMPELLEYMKKTRPGEPFDDEVTRIYAKDFEAMSKYFGANEDGKVSFSKHGKKVFDGELDLIKSRSDDVVIDWKRSQGILF